MDGDIFGAVNRLGRDAAEGLARAIHGAEWDSFLARRCLEKVIAAAGGVPSLAAVMDVLRAIQATPLLAPALVEDSAERIADAVRGANGTVLDLVLRSVALKCILCGEYEPFAVLQRFCEALLERSILSGRGGFYELENGGLSHRDKAIALIAPVAADAARILEMRPEAKRLGLSRQHARLSPDSDLLGGESCVLSSIDTTSTVLGT